MTVSTQMGAAWGHNLTRSRTLVYTHAQTYAETEPLHTKYLLTHLHTLIKAPREAHQLESNNRCLLHPLGTVQQSRAVHFWFGPICHVAPEECSPVRASA